MPSLNRVRICVDGNESSAVFSKCLKYRFVLGRAWRAGKGMAMNIGLNPSTATETEDDPTIRRCIGFAKSWGCNSLVMLNLFGFRATKPADMKRARNPIGRANDLLILSHAEAADKVVCAWGAGGGFRNRDREVFELIREHSPLCLRLTKAGHPWHPLYLPKTAALSPFTIRKG